MIGNKSESGRREVDFETAQEFAKKNEMVFLEVSAKFGTNVDQTFQLLAENLFEEKSFSKKVFLEENFLLENEENETQTLFSFPERNGEIRFVKNLQSLSCCRIL